MEDKKKIQRGIDVVVNKQVYASMKKDLFSGMLQEAGLNEEEIANTLKNDVKSAIEDVTYTPQDFEEMETEEYKQWEAEQKAEEERRNKRLNK